jgi:hypothetical protein
MIAIMRQSGVGLSLKIKLAGEIRQTLATMEKLAAHSIIPAETRRKMRSKFRRLGREFERILPRKCRARRLAQMPSQQRRAFEHVLGLIYDCAPNRSSAKLLVDRILSRLT